MLEFYGMSHVDVPVGDVDASLRFYEGVLGLRVVQRGEGFADLDAHTARIRLLQVGSSVRRASLRLQVGQVEAAHAYLTASGARSEYPPTRTAANELVATVLDPDGNGLTVWRGLTEDELDAPVELPKQGPWHPEAEALLKSLLASVPALFRMLARRSVVRLAEELAEGRQVQTLEVVRAYILSNAKVTRYRTREPLKKHGFNPDDFRAEYDE